MTSLSLGPPRPERADAARNRQQLLATAREMLAAAGPDTLTMDALAERSGLGKGTVFRRFRTRAGIFQALLDDSERELQERVLSGPPPLGPGAPPVERLIAYGKARVAFLFANLDVARLSLDGRQPAAGQARTPASQLHISVLLRELSLPGVNVPLLAVQLTAALDGPLLLYLSSQTRAEDAERELCAAWQTLVERVCR